MNRMHPDKKTLQRFLNNRLSELDSKRIAQHLRTCSDCRYELDAYVELEMRLDALPLLEAPPGLSDNVMNTLRQEQQADKSDTILPKQRTFWRTELANGLIAAAATFLFIYSGVLGKLISLDAFVLSEGVRSGATYVYRTIETISYQLLT
ncbi:anti-sigma factor family protein [Paenibacillus cremeus]|uniref:Anti-sigma-W factor RsiW n=1 Tax=Paenibacillus cremeus TaxID=2163881 RepID=A0A559JMH2_9BACL|nr:anti-sigma factor [Paenibacillus cremeus]TVY01058.1 hypothetical protein FPZ49_32650 [Paenibacillus cremeus]